MCLYVVDAFHPNRRSRIPLVAKQPILVWKQLDNCNDTHGYSPYRGTRWDYGKEKTVHRFTYGGGARRRDYRLVEGGLHAFTSVTAIRIPSGGNICPAVIPVGARFWLGCYDEIVSDKMTVYRTVPDLFTALGITKFAKPIRKADLT